MVAIKNIVFFAISATAAVLPTRDVQPVLNALSTVNTDTVDLGTKTTNWDGSTSGSIPIQQASNKLDKDIQAATTTTNNNGAATEAEADQVLNYINNTLEPNIVKTINAVIAKKTQFQNANLATTAKNNLNSIQKDSDALADALIAKAPASRASAGQAAKTKIHNDIQKGIDAFA